MNSFQSGPIFQPPSNHKTSRNAFVGAILFPEQISLAGTGPGHESEMSKFRRFSKFIAAGTVASRKLLRFMESGLRHLGVLL